MDAVYPKAEKEWIWQYVFPAKRQSADPKSDDIIEMTAS